VFARPRERTDAEIDRRARVSAADGSIISIRRASNELPRCIPAVRPLVRSSIHSSVRPFVQPAIHPSIHLSILRPFVRSAKLKIRLYETRKPEARPSEPLRNLFSANANSASRRRIHSLPLGATRSRLSLVSRSEARSRSQPAVRETAAENPDERFSVSSPPPPLLTVARSSRRKSGASKVVKGARADRRKKNHSDRRARARAAARRSGIARALHFVTGAFCQSRHLINIVLHNITLRFVREDEFGKVWRLITRS